MVLINCHEEVDYVLHRGKIYKKQPASRYTYLSVIREHLSVFCRPQTITSENAWSVLKRVINKLSDEACHRHTFRSLLWSYAANHHRVWSYRGPRRALLVDKRTAFHRTSRTGKRHWNCNTQGVLFYGRTTTTLQPQYFKENEMLQNSLTENDVVSFCDDFLKLLNFSKTKHRDKLHAHFKLDIIQHSNVATFFVDVISMLHSGYRLFFGLNPCTLRFSKRLWHNFWIDAKKISLVAFKSYYHCWKTSY